MLARYFFASLLLVLGLVARPAAAQYVEDDKPSQPPVYEEPWHKKLRPGGNFGAQFGNITYIEVSPLVGYQVTERFVPGLGASYIYYAEKFNGRTFSTSLYGPRVFARYILLQEQNIFVHGEVQSISAERFDTRSGESKGRRWLTSPLLGGGVLLPIGKRSAFMIMALYNFAYESNNAANTLLYNPPIIIRVGFSL
jgi:hypothetical protein